MRKFIITLLLVVGLALLVFLYLRANADKLPPDTLAGRAGQALTPAAPEAAPRMPENYHLLEGSGGIPRTEAEAAGLVGDAYAWLDGLGPINLSRGVEASGGHSVAGNAYDLCYIYNSRQPAEQYAEFNLNGEWDELHFGFGFDDGHPSDPTGKWAIEVSIQGDGRVIYGPYEIRPTTRPLFAMADVAGVNRVTFICRRIGHKNTFAPLVIDPFVIRSADDAPDPAAAS